VKGKQHFGRTTKKSKKKTKRENKGDAYRSDRFREEERRVMMLAEPLVNSENEEK
jgi:hypothetical protein